MKCYHHPDRDAVSTCSVCGKALCKECTDKYSPILCEKCHEELQAELDAQAAQQKKDNNRYTRGNVLSSFIYLAVGFGIAWLMCRFFDYTMKYHIFSYYFCIFIFLPFAIRTAIIVVPNMGKHFSVGCIGSILWYGSAIVFPPLFYLIGTLDGAIRISQSVSNKKIGLTLGILYAILFTAITLLACLILMGMRDEYLETDFGYTY